LISVEDFVVPVAYSIYGQTFDRPPFLSERKPSRSINCSTIIRESRTGRYNPCRQARLRQATRSAASGSTPAFVVWAYTKMTLDPQSRLGRSCATGGTTSASTTRWVFMVPSPRSSIGPLGSNRNLLSTKFFVCSLTWTRPGTPAC